MRKQSDLVSVSQGSGGDPLYIDTTNNRVGIGTSSPARTLHVQTNQQVIGRFNAGTNTKAILSLEDTNTTGENYVSIASEGNDMFFRAGGSERMRIDNAGRVTMPYQPAFKASRLSGNVGAGNTFVFNSASFNTGGHYNTSTGRFTAPVSGVYQFNVILLTANTNPTGHYYWRVLLNGSTSFVDAYSHNDTANTYVHYPASFSLYLSTNDYIEISVSAGTFFSLFLYTTYAADE